MHNFFFGIYPYIALAVMILGSIARYETRPVHLEKLLFTVT